MLLTSRGSDFEVTVGREISIGYARHDTNEVELYLTEFMQFRALQPEAAIELRGKQGQVSATETLIREDSYHGYEKGWWQLGR